MDPRKFVLFVSLGNEIRNFVFGGILENLRTIGDCYAFSCKESKLLEQLCIEHHLSLITIPTSKVKSIRHKNEWKFLSSRRARLRISGVKTFQLLSESPNIRLKDYLIGNRIIYKLLQEKNAKAVNSYYYSEFLAQKYSTFNITDVLFQGYASPEILTAAITAKRLNINIWVINWGWKDFFINEYFNFKPKGFFTWSQTFKDLYCRFNDVLDDSNVHVIGNVSFDIMCKANNNRDLKPYLKKYNLPEKAKFFIYTLLNPTVCKKEEEIVKLLLEKTKRINELFILIKPNPMDPEWRRFYAMEKDYSNVRIMENLWEYDHDNNFNMITTAGVKEWEDLLHLCTGTINVPSTVTIESLLCQKPVINPLYDKTNQVSSEFLRLYNSSFYKHVKDRTDVIAAHTVSDTFKAINKIIKGEIRVVGTLDSICVMGKALEKFSKVVEEAN